MNQRLLRTIGLSWLVFGLAGMAIAMLFPIPTVTVLIDRSYCAPAQWQQVAAAYETLYLQHQHQAITIDRVIIFSDLGQDVRTQLPSPSEIRRTRTYGRHSLQQQQVLQQQYPKAELLACQ